MTEPGPEPRRYRAPLASYVNYFEIGQNAFEFLLDFGQYDAASAETSLHTRVAMGPAHAKLLSGMLAAAVSRHEAEHGPISEPEPELDPLEVVKESLEGFDNAIRPARPRR